jgi:hypothetical protein
MEITSIDKAIDNLPRDVRCLFERLYTSDVYTGCMRIPEEMKPWVVNQFGSLEAVTEQKVTRLTNKVTGEETIFNPLRLKRPHDVKDDDCLSLDRVDMGVDSFDTPEGSTSEDIFGRIQGKHCITASNIAKCDEWHGIVVFKEHHPLRFNEEQVSDYLDTAWRWARAAHRESPDNKYFFYSWNCLWRSAASLIHGHNQMMLTRRRHFARIESLRKSALAYRRRFRGNYFDDLFTAHRSLGLAFDKQGVRALAYLTPVKSNEIVLIAEDFNNDFKKCVYESLAFYRDALGVQSFNLALTMPPLGPTRESWEGFPVIAWLVDRGELSNRSSDIGALELFASTAVTSDPFVLSEKLGVFLRNTD